MVQKDEVTAEQNVFDLSIFDTKTKANEGFEVEIVDAFGEPTGLFITILGADSTTFERATERWQREQLKIGQQRGRNNPSATSELMSKAREHDLQTIADCTVDWRHTTATMPFKASDKSKLMDFYARSKTVYDQVFAALADRRNFTKASPKI